MALELDDNYETLAAALALIDEWELELCSDHDALSEPHTQRSPSPTAATTSEDSDATRDSPVHSPSPSEVASASTSACKPRRRKARDELDEPTAAQAQRGRREELVFLRRKVRELEAQLASIRAAPVEQSDATKTHAKEVQQLDATWVWQQIASRQLEHRQKSERENLKLRVQVEEQIKIAKDLMRVLMRAYRHGEESASDPEETQQIKRVKLPVGEECEMSESEQLQRLTELYSEREAIFSVAPFTDGAPVFRDIRVHEHDNGEMTINVDSSWVLPFAVDHITRAFWMYLVRKSETDEWKFDKTGRFEDDRDVLVTKYEASGEVNRQACTFHGQFVARRFASPDGEAPAYVAWHKWTNPINFRPSSMEGVSMHAQTMARIVWADQAMGSSSTASGPSPPHTTAEEGRMSLMQISQRVHVGFSAAETPTRRRRVGILTDYMMYTVDSELGWKQEVLENLLLRSTMPSAPLHVPTWTYKKMALRDFNAS